MLIEHPFDVVIVVVDYAANFGKGKGATLTESLERVRGDCEKPADFMGFKPLASGTGLATLQDGDKLVEEILFESLEVVERDDVCYHNVYHFVLVWKQIKVFRRLKDRDNFLGFVVYSFKNLDFSSY